MSLARVASLALPLLASCNLFVSLDPLSDGESGASGGGSASTSTLSGPGPSTSSAGGGGASGSGGSGPTAWQQCVASADPLIHLRMSGSITEPNLGST
jgi:hypothetical protein